MSLREAAKRQREDVSDRLTLTIENFSAWLDGQIAMKKIDSIDYEEGNALIGKLEQFRASLAERNGGIEPGNQYHWCIVTSLVGIAIDKTQTIFSANVVSDEKDCAKYGVRKKQIGMTADYVFDSSTFKDICSSYPRFFALVGSISNWTSKASATDGKENVNFTTFHPETVVKCKTSRKFQHVRVVDLSTLLTKDMHEGIYVPVVAATVAEVKDAPVMQGKQAQRKFSLQFANNDVRQVTQWIKGYDVHTKDFQEGEIYFILGLYAKQSYLNFGSYAQFIPKNEGESYFGVRAEDALQDTVPAVRSNLPKIFE